MKVTISVGGKFHAFHLAKQLDKRGYLDNIFTSYPWFALKDSGLAKEKVRCLFAKEILERGLNKIPYLKKMIDIHRFTLDFFDQQVARGIGPCDIFNGASGYSLQTMRKIRESFSAKIIIERVSSHIEVYRDILTREERESGVKSRLPSFSGIEKELQEYAKADYIAVPSLFAKETFLKKNFSEDKLICVPWGVDIKVFRPIPKKDKVFRIICVGARVIKGIHYILKAIDELNLKGLEFWIIDGGVEDGLLPFFRRYRDKIRHLGAIPQKKLYEYYSQGSVLVMFSLEDGFGMALLEAMACGLPVICSDSVGAKDAVRDNTDGFIIPTRDVARLKEKIGYLYENPDIARQMGQAARENAADNFTWDDYGKKIVDVYRDLLKRPSHA